MIILGLDIGSVISKAVLLDEAFHVKGRWQRHSRGDPAGTIMFLIRRAIGKAKDFTLKIGLTGSGRALFELPGEILSLNEILSSALGAATEYPGVKSVIVIGGHSSCWLRLEKGFSGEIDTEIADFTLNERCAAGSGAFLEQQATRLKLGIEEFSELAAEAVHGAPIAGRCSVFAKTDMIHLQQKGTPVDEICYGVCLAMARNYMATILRGRECVPPILFTGGAAQNRGLVRAFREHLKKENMDLSVSKNPLYTGALGAAVWALRYGKELEFSDVRSIGGVLELKKSLPERTLKPLGTLHVENKNEPLPAENAPMEGYLGVDVGSVSTNLAFLDLQGEVITGVYLSTRGKPLEVLKEAYEQLIEKCPARLSIMGVGTTGSGRYLAGRFLQSDVIHNEITCQLVGTKYYFPDVDTIFEIGGQDSKYIRVQGGRIHDFTMNKICSAGTGSFLEEQAAHLGIDVENEFSVKASLSQEPCDLGSQCTVFMDTELVNALSQGVTVPDITAGLAYSIARNYLEKVVSDRDIGKNIVFQGGVASNPAVVRAFTLLLNRPIRVHPHNRISGAIGAALIAKNAVESLAAPQSKTAQIERRLQQPYTLSSFRCNGCPNQCHVNLIRFEEETIYFGDICEKYTSKQDYVEEPIPVPDLFQERDNLLRDFIRNPEKPTHRIGLPKASFLYEYLPFWISFFNTLGCQVSLSPSTTMEILERGLSKLPTETCLPIKIAFGHAQWLLRQDVDFVFIPSLIDPNKNQEERHYLCPYCEHLPYMLRYSPDERMLFPCVNLGAEMDDFVKNLSSVREKLGSTDAEIKKAFWAGQTAQEKFAVALRKRGSEILEKSEEMGNNVWAVIGKPYNIHDAFLNLNLGKHLQKLNVVALPMDFIPYNDQKLPPWHRLPPWRFNRQIIKSTLWCSSKKHIFPVFATNFGCGPDAFTMKHLPRILEKKPYLFLEFDEHRGEAGLITRLEAFWDEINQAKTHESPGLFANKVGEKKNKGDIEAYKKRSFVLPYFADHAFAFSGALRGVGIKAEVLPLPDEQSISLGEKHSLGKECHAYAIIAGDLIKFARSEREGLEVYYFPGTADLCLLAQYGEGMNYILEDLGIKDLEVLSPTAGFLFSILETPGLTLLWQGLVAVDLLVRVACELRPYEDRSGQTDRIHKVNLLEIESGLADGSFHEAWKNCVDRINEIHIHKEWRPKIGIAGDLYTRQHPVANHGLFHKLEAMGCEVWPPPLFVDDVDFGMRKSISEDFKTKRYRDLAVKGFLSLKKDFEAWKIKKRIKGAMERLSEPAYKKVLEFSKPYIHPENNRILLLNIAKMVDFARRGADGVINVICLNCMLGTVSEAISAQIKRDHDKIPIPTLVFSGTHSPLENTKLEAFVYQVQRYAQRKKRENSIRRETNG
jgi:predicted CoA-substrate-specific enzyme activase